MKLVYVAGPFTDNTPWGIEANIRKAEETAACILLARDDWSLIVPHSLGRHFVGRAGTPEYWYASTMRMMEACSAICLVYGWQRSKGSRAEFRRAAELGIEIYEGHTDAIEGICMSENAIAMVLESLEL